MVTCLEGDVCGVGPLFLILARWHRNAGSSTPPLRPAAVGPYSHAVVAGGLLFCSGQIPLDPATGELVGDTAPEQARRCLENLRAVCEAAGASLAERCA